MAKPSAMRIGVRGLTRRFGNLIANDAITLSVARGTIHAIVGANGAGKTTLMRILQGIDRPDAGDVLVDGEPVVLSSPADAFRRGIGMVHQEFMQVAGLTLLENLILGTEPVQAFGHLDRKAALRKAKTLAAMADVDLDWDMRADRAPIHVRQIVEILRLLHRDVDVLILDEPTAVLAPAQIAEFLGLMRRLRVSGRTLLFISHKLDEVLAVADHITILRAGRVVGSVDPGQSRAALADLMIGTATETPSAKPARPGARVLSVQGLSARDGRGITRLRDVDFEVYAGEIVGIAAVAGNGQDELIACVAGLAAPDRGRLLFDGRDVTMLPIGRRRHLGLRYLSPDRAHEGLCLDASIRDNAIAGHQRRPDFLAGPFLKAYAVRRHVGRLLDRFAVVHGGVSAPIKSLSGGNQQRVAMARELDGGPKLLIACQPTRGVDIGGIAALHGFLFDYRAGGGAVLLVSEDLDEVLTLSDRIVVLYGGRIMGIVARGSADIQTIGRMMLGRRAA